MKAIEHILINSAEEKPLTKPDVQVAEREQDEEEIKTPWRLILYNDEIHTFDEVIQQLIKALGCTEEKAEEIAIKVHNDGKAKVYEGSFEECLRINSVLQEIQLVTEIKG